MDNVRFGFKASSIIKEGRVNQADIDTIDKWSLVQSQLPRLTQEQIVLFLLSCQNDIEDTKKTIKAFYSIRNANPILFTGRDVKSAETRRAMRTIETCTTFEKRTHEGLSLLFGRLNDTYYAHLDLTQWVKAMFMIIDVMIYDNPPTGFMVMIDMKGFGVMHLTRLSPKLLLPLFRYLQEGLPTRLVGIHIINSNYLVSAIMRIISPFINAELIKKLHFHPPSLDMNQFFNAFISRSVVSEDYGGDLPPVKELSDITIEKLINMKGHFDAEEKQRLSAIVNNN